ncbi:hypothetical protein PT7_2502 [Pusillimonas sp. T7-7]|nr:hypothetical protein PT7_2502 [Pusillimonas sp. T7-7]
MIKDMRVVQALYWLKASANTGFHPRTTHHVWFAKFCQKS